MPVELRCPCLIERVVGPQVAIDVRVALLGAVASGKSTLVGVLATGELDNGTAPFAPNPSSVAVAARVRTDGPSGQSAATVRTLSSVPLGETNGLALGVNGLIPTASTALPRSGVNHEY